MNDTNNAALVRGDAGLAAEISDLRSQILLLKQENESIFRKIQHAQRFWGISIIVGCSALLLTIR